MLSQPDQIYTPALVRDPSGDTRCSNLEQSSRLTCPGPLAAQRHPSGLDNVCSVNFTIHRIIAFNIWSFILKSSIRVLGMCCVCGWKFKSVPGCGDHLNKTDVEDLASHDPLLRSGVVLGFAAVSTRGRTSCANERTRKCPWAIKLMRWEYNKKKKRHDLWVQLFNRKKKNYKGKIQGLM